MHSAIAEACGDEAATPALGPAIDELMAITEAPFTTSWVNTLSVSTGDKNLTSDDSKDIYSKSRQFMERDYVSSVDHYQVQQIGLWSILFIWMLYAYGA